MRADVDAVIFQRKPAIFKILSKTNKDLLMQNL